MLKNVISKNVPVTLGKIGLSVALSLSTIGSVKAMENVYHPNLPEIKMPNMQNPLNRSTMIDYKEPPYGGQYDDNQSGIRGMLNERKSMRINKFLQKKKTPNSPFTLPSYEESSANPSPVENNFVFPASDIAPEDIYTAIPVLPSSGYINPDRRYETQGNNTVFYPSFKR